MKVGPPPERPWWARGAHAQTTWGRLGPSRATTPFEREVLETPDGDDLIVDHLANAADGPRVIILHGLEGSSRAGYVQGLATGAARAGMRVTAVNFRSCARDLGNAKLVPNRRPRLYHAGDTRDLDLVVDTLAKREPKTPLLAVGVSLGGNVLLKWLGEKGARSRVEAAVAISPPYDLAATAKHLEQGWARAYSRHFLRSLRPKALELMKRFPRETEHMDPGRIRIASTLFAFDEYVTAPLHGFRGARDYYSRSSCVRFLGDIEVPTLCINSEDDPFMPPGAIGVGRQAASEDVHVVATPWGGHAAFVYGSWPWRARYWAEETAISWLASRPA
ncbi:MAG TPA: alpha/beta fold hydrolase [Polyangia bacterium]|nr:alpha/beta fold hydrolase [Polyangia bacterium]